MAYNWFAACKASGGLPMLFLGILVCAIAIPFGMILPFHMSHRPGVDIPKRFVKEN